MGRILVVRVLAETYKPEEVARAWPRLRRLAFGGDESRGGVLELVATLADRLRFSDEVPEAAKQGLGAGAERLVRLKDTLEERLGDRDPSGADAVTYEIEDLLDALERKAPKE
jgi:sugar (pentulose or hexulose) kinase